MGWLECPPMASNSLHQSKPSYDSLISSVSAYTVYMKPNTVAVGSQAPYQFAVCSACLCLKTLFKYDQ